MKNIFIIFILLFSLACSNSDDKEGSNTDTREEVSTEVAKIKAANSKCVFEKQMYDLGKIQQGEIVKYTMKFRNEGEELLVINNAHASCGCTVPKWTKEPIAKGEEGQLEVTFDSSGRKGVQHKSVVLITNSVEKMVEVSFVAEVIAPEE